MFISASELDMSLKHLTALAVPRADGASEQVHIGDDGCEVSVLTAFGRVLRTKGYAASTRDRYALAAARFVDFLIECGAFGRHATAARIADAVSAYPIFLRDGRRASWPGMPTLGGYAAEIGFAGGLARNSFAPTLAAVNLLLAVARDEEMRAASAWKGRTPHLDVPDVQVAFAAIDGDEVLSAFEKENLRQRSMIAAVVRTSGDLSRPRGLRKPVHGGVVGELENKEFPFASLGLVLDAARTSRDRCLWALLAGGGLRIHEALGIRICDVDVAGAEVYVVDPERRRAAVDLRDPEMVRFKGRTVSRVFMFEPLRTVFWTALRDYLRTEFVPNGDGSDDFLFVKLDAVGRGTPLLRASDAAVGKQFKEAVRRCGVPGPREAPDHVWTLHSLRHLYGVYMLNYIPVVGGPGLLEAEVQILMGHASIESTKVYARRDRTIVEAKVEVANVVVFDGIDAVDQAVERLPRLIADRLRKVADEMDGGRAPVLPGA